MVKLIIAFGIGYFVGVLSIALAMSGYEDAQKDALIYQNRRKENNVPGSNR